MNHNAVEAAISLLANNLRIYAEAQFRFAELFHIDREEAIDNVDRAFETNLEGFHKLYDVSKAEFDYFAYADSTLIIAMRNAIHHRDHPLFESLLANIFCRSESKRWFGAQFLLAKHKAVGRCAEHFFRIDDFYQRLDPSASSPYLESVLRKDKAQKRFQLVATDLSFETIRQTGERERYPAAQVYLDVIPIFISAVGRVFRALKSRGFSFRGYDASTYLLHFSRVKVDLQTVTFNTTRFS